MITINKTQVQIAEELGIQQPSISRWLNGIRFPSFSNILLLSKCLEVDPQDLMVYIMTQRQMRKDNENQQLEQVPPIQS